MITLLTLLILKQGAMNAAPSVTFEIPDPCAMKGSSVVFRCSYNYEDDDAVIKVAWYKGVLRGGQWKRVVLSDLPSYENRTEYLGDLEHNCSLAIHDVQNNDTGYYYIRFDTTKYGWRSKQSVHLSIAELNARVSPRSVRAGDYVSLECETSCQNLSVIWFKDGHPVAQPKFQAQKEDAGKYVCSLQGQESVQSDPVALDVQYPPVNVSVERSYPGSLTAGSSVNLTCSSDANPAANYTWFGGSVSSFNSMDQVGSGQVLSIPSMSASHTGLYLCQASNQLGENNSTGVLLTVDDTDIHRLLLLLGIGVKVVIVLLLTLVIIWAWRTCRHSADDIEENNQDYENIQGLRKMSI